MKLPRVPSNASAPQARATVIVVLPTVRPALRIPVPSSLGSGHCSALLYAGTEMLMFCAPLKAPGHSFVLLLLGQPLLLWALPPASHCHADPPLPGCGTSALCPFPWVSTCSFNRLPLRICWWVLWSTIPRLCSFCTLHSGLRLSLYPVITGPTLLLCLHDTWITPETQIPVPHEICTLLHLRDQCHCHSKGACTPGHRQCDSSMCAWSWDPSSASSFECEHARLDTKRDPPWLELLPIDKKELENFSSLHWYWPSWWNCTETILLCAPRNQRCDTPSSWRTSSHHQLKVILHQPEEARRDECSLKCTDINTKPSEISANKGTWHHKRNTVIFQ